VDEVKQLAELGSFFYEFKDISYRNSFVVRAVATYDCLKTSDV